MWVRGIVSNFLKSKRYRLHFHRDYYLVRENAKYKNIHKGKRCFILGNGPSLKTQDLSYLEEEYVFTVNQAAKMKQFREVKTNYHFWNDPVFFDLSKEKAGDVEVLKAFQDVNTDGNQPVTFIPLEHKNFVEQHGFDTSLNISFYDDSVYFHEGYRRDVRFDRAAPRSHTIVQYAIFMAVYMGFETIYLMGCDCTGILAVINTYLNRDTDAYSYEITEGEKQRIQDLQSVYNMEEIFLNHYGVLHDYRLIQKYCAKRNIRLVNCTRSTILDSIPRESYESVITS